MLWFLATAHSLVVLSLSVRIFLRQNITDPARLAWFISFAFLPVIGSIIYLMFGEVYLSRRLIARHNQTKEAVFRLGPDVLGAAEQFINEIGPEHRAAFRYSASVNGFAPTGGNRFELMEGDDDFRERLIADIDAAREAINILYYIWLDDNTGTQIAEAVARAARRGVTCRILIDEFGSRRFLKSDLWASMKESGAECYAAMPVERFRRFSRINRFDLRNHRKITVIDGCIAYCGSQNCADPEFRIKEKYAPWVDIMTRLKGPAVNQMLIMFANDWINTVHGQAIDDFDFGAKPVEGGCIAQARGTGPLERPFSAIQAFLTAIHGARDSLTITTPYFVPDQTLLSALCEAALSGVEVTLNLPARNDSWIVSAASRSHYHPLLQAGVRIFEYQPGLLHSKIMTIDGVFSIIGSSNLDLRSLGLNYENDMLIYDRETTSRIRTRQESYLAESDPVDIQDVTEWSITRRVWYNVVGTLSPLL